VTLFLDTSLLLAASGSSKGASREIFWLAPKQQWTLITIPYVLEEVTRNLKNLPHDASADWVRLRRQLTIEDNVLSLDRPTTFDSAKDRPILFSALAWADVLLRWIRKILASCLAAIFMDYRCCGQAPSWNVNAR
jgi:hypothetical protein